MRPSMLTVMEIPHNIIFLQVDVFENLISAARFGPYVLRDMRQR